MADRDAVVPAPLAQVRKQLILFYQLYNPEKLDQVDSILEVYRGHEGKLFSVLKKKYGVEGGGTAASVPAPYAGTSGASKPVAPHHNWLVELAKGWQCSNHQIDDVQKLVERFEGSTAELIKLLFVCCLRIQILTKQILLKEEKSLFVTQLASSSTETSCPSTPLPPHALSSSTLEVQSASSSIDWLKC